MGTTIRQARDEAGAPVLKSIGIWIVAGSVSVWGITFETFVPVLFKNKLRFVCVQAHVPQHLYGG